MSINKVTLLGFVGKDPEIRKTNNNNEVALFSLATSTSWTDKNSNEKQEKTEWHRVVVFNQGLVNVVKNYVKKGSKLYVCGELQNKKWIDKSGINHYLTEVVLNSFDAKLELCSSQPSVNNANSCEEVPEFSVSFVDDEPIAYSDEIPF